MKILYFSNPIDPAGVSVNMASALLDYTEHECKYAIEQTTHVVDLDHLREKGVNPIRLNEKGGVEKLRAAIEWSDIVHINAAMANWPLLLHDTIDVEEMLEGKGILFHTHGGAWLLNPDWICERCESIGALMVTCSPLDEIVAPGIKWVPNVLPDYIKPQNRQWDGRLICGQACGDALYKGGGIVEYVFDWIQKTVRGFEIEYELVLGKSYLESIEIRKQHHMTIDNWTQGFHGMSALEGMAMGHATFSRFHPMAWEKWLDFCKEPIPIIDIAGMDEFGKWLRVFDKDRDALKAHGEISRKWIKEYYTERQVIQCWVKVYEEVLGEVKKREKLPPRQKLRLMPMPALDELLRKMYLRLIPFTNSPVVGYILDDLPPDEAMKLIADTEDDAYVICRVGPSGKPALYEILKRTERRLHRYLKGVLDDGSSLFSLEPK